MVQQMPKLRVGLILDNVGWQGGVNYYRNLLTAVQSAPNLELCPVVFAGMKSDVSPYEGLAEIVRSPIFDRHALAWLIRKVLTKGGGRDYFLYKLLVANKIDIVSHSGLLWKNSPIPSIAWMPDFQHIHLPEFFTPQEYLNRNNLVTRMISHSNAILLSSNNASSDLKGFLGGADIPAYVLKFVSCMRIQPELAFSKPQIEAKYALDKPWFYLPNQFWAHKNHGLVIEALHLLKKQGIPMLVIATGSKNDYRNPNYFPTLQNKISEYGLKDDFRILGLLPYEEVLSLLRYSVAVINPSRFEGWSTTVEEAKSWGKEVLLSDIPIHREQMPERAKYFDQNSPAELAAHMLDSLTHFSDEYEEQCFYDTQRSFDGRRQAFAEQYAEILRAVLSANSAHGVCN